MSFVESLRIRVGEEIFASDLFEVRQTDIDVFAAVTRDWDYMHNDPVWAAEASPWGRSTIAHGYYLVSLLMYFHGLAGFPTVKSNDEYMINYGIDRVRFTAAVRTGDLISAHIELRSLTRKDPGRDLVGTRTAYYSQRCGSQPHMVADILFLCIATPPHGQKPQSGAFRVTKRTRPTLSNLTVEVHPVARGNAAQRLTYSRTGTAACAG
jgi:acyl dehydratase